MHDKIKKHVERQKERKQEFVYPISSIWNISGEEYHIQIKTTESFDGTYIQHDSNGDTALSGKEYLKKMKTHFIDII